MGKSKGYWCNRCGEEFIIPKDRGESFSFFCNVCGVGATFVEDREIAIDGIRGHIEELKNKIVDLQENRSFFPYRKTTRIGNSDKE